MKTTFSSSYASWRMTGLLEHQLGTAPPLATRLVAPTADATTTVTRTASFASVTKRPVAKSTLNDEIHHRRPGLTNDAMIAVANPTGTKASTGTSSRMDPGCCHSCRHQRKWTNSSPTSSEPIKLTVFSLIHRLQFN